MDKKELTAAVAEKTGMSKSEAAAAVDAVFDTITESLQSGTEVRILGFGSFSVSQRAAKTGRNPRTGQTINIPASKTAKFKPGKSLKMLVNDGWTGPRGPR